MQTRTVYPVILSGGSGTRLWPVSRPNMPKQFLPLISDKSMFAATLDRVNDSLLYANPVIVGNIDHQFLIAGELDRTGIQASSVILEPVGRNTAPAIALAALQLLKTDPNALMLIMPSDHVISELDEFHKAVKSACHAANKGFLVTFGIKPKYPETGYGYIESDRKIYSSVNPAVHKVKNFIEKPSLKKAEKLLEQGGYAWNSGIFLIAVRDYLNELNKTYPDIISKAQDALAKAEKTGINIKPKLKDMEQCHSESIDYAVMEKTSKAAVVAARFSWTDAGSWKSVWEASEKDLYNNVKQGDVIIDSTTECYIRGNKRLISTIGLNDLVIIDSDDALLIAHKNRTQDVKQVVDNLKMMERDEVTQTKEVSRPWGTFNSIHQGDKHQVKHITVEPGASLSLQYHHCRSEHWIVVQGIAEVQIEDRNLLVGPNESVYIEKGETHRLTNKGKSTLHLIEVQCGDYLGEDDIVRLDDNYGRVEQSGVTSIHQGKLKNVA